MKLEELRHSAAHVLAQAVKELFPKIKLGIGPAIENGFYYDFDKKESFTPSDLRKIEKKMQKIIKENLPIKKILVSKNEAKKILKNESYKLELLGGLKDKKISFYQQGKFIDLCRGPHLKSTGQIKAFKLLNIAGAYWKGDERNPMLQRIYGTAFQTEKELKNFLKIREEAEKRDHRKLGKQLDLFSFHDEAPGAPFWHTKGTIIFNELINFLREEYRKRDYKEIITPLILSKELWLKSGHWEHYKDNMYFTKIDKKDYAIKPMNCPAAILIYKEKLHSYKEFPIRTADFGVLHRHELSGVIHGLMRVRKFMQDDGHIFCLPEQIKKEVIDLIEFTDYLYKIFGFREYHIELSTKPKDYIGSDEIWEKSTAALKAALKAKKIKFKINEGEGAFYGPKIDFHIKDCLGRTWQCATIQLDFSIPQRFNLTYLDKDDKRKQPVMIHRALLGSLERFIGILIEHYGGKFPLWLAPVQVKILTVIDKNKKFAEKLKKELEENKIRVELDDRLESMGRKVRDAQLQKIPMILTIGDKEQKKKTVAVRTLDGKVKFGVKIKKFIQDILKNIENKKC